MTRIVIAIIKVYQLTLSPLFGNCCRFYPSCSNYMIGALREHGFINGTYLGVVRICKCHPFHPGGCDPVPTGKKRNQKEIKRI